MKIPVKLIFGGKIPVFKTDGAVCCDCYSRVDNFEEATVDKNGKKVIVIPEGKRKLIPLGFILELPVGWEAVIRPRSGNSLKGIDISIGTIDYDYRGEVMANVVNNTGLPLEIYHWDRICQLAIRQVPGIDFELVENVSETARGSQGFGHTGK